MILQKLKLTGAIYLDNKTLFRTNELRKYATSTGKQIRVSFKFLTDGFSHVKNIILVKILITYTGIFFPYKL